jgi:uncharacterized protein YcnI
LVTVALLAIAVPASAHVIVAEEEVVGGGEGAVIHFRVPHGCEGAATDAIEVQIPEGIIGVTPEAVPGWTVETESVETEPYELYGSTLTERVSVVRWSGGTLPDHQFLDFGMSAIFPENPTELTFPIVQHCGADELAWIELPEAGQDPEELEHPAPTLTVVAEGEADLQAVVDDLAARVVALEAEVEALREP